MPLLEFSNDAVVEAQYAIGFYISRQICNFASVIYPSYISFKAICGRVKKIEQQRKKRMNSLQSSAAGPHMTLSSTATATSSSSSSSTVLNALRKTEEEEEEEEEIRDKKEKKKSKALFPSLAGLPKINIFQNITKKKKNNKSSNSSNSSSSSTPSSPSIRSPSSILKSKFFPSNPTTTTTTTNATDHNENNRNRKNNNNNNNSGNRMPSSPVTAISNFLFPSSKKQKNAPSQEQYRFRYENEVQQWLTYWIIFSLLNTLEFILELSFTRIPFYWEMKLLFVIWLQHPKTRGAEYIYHHYVEPFMKKHEKNIDEQLNLLSQKFSGSHLKKLAVYLANVSATQIQDRSLAHVVAQTTTVSDHNPIDLIKYIQSVNAAAAAAASATSSSNTKKRKSDGGIGDVGDIDGGGGSTGGDNDENDYDIEKIKKIDDGVGNIHRGKYEEIQKKKEITIVDDTLKEVLETPEGMAVVNAVTRGITDNRKEIVNDTDDENNENEEEDDNEEEDNEEDDNEEEDNDDNGEEGIEGEIYNQNGVGDKNDGHNGVNSGDSVTNSNTVVK